MTFKRKNLLNRLKSWNTLLINLLKYKKLLPSNFIVVDDKKLAYLITPKVACSSIKATFIDYEIPDNYLIHKLPWKIIHTEKSVNKNYFKFTFVRNPFERLVSCYENKYHSDKQNGIPAYYDTFLFGILKKDNGFDNFALNVCKFPTFLADMHFMKQSSIIYKNNKAIVDFIGKFENLKNDFEPIRIKYSLKSLPNLNKSNKRNWMDYYSIKSAKKVYKYYRKDIELFGYQEEYDKLISYLKQK